MANKLTANISAAIHRVGASIMGGTIGVNLTRLRYAAKDIFNKINRNGPVKYSYAIFNKST